LIERTTRDGRFIEEIGYHNPISKQSKVRLDRYDYWLGKGAKPTPAVAGIVKKVKALAAKGGA